MNAVGVIVSDSDRKLKIALVYDQPEWILSEIAKYLEEHLNRRSEIMEIRSYQSPQSYFRLLKIEASNDVIHFLSPWDYYKYAQVIIKPCVVTVHHLINDEHFNDTKSRASAICVPSLQWYNRLINDLLCEPDNMFITPYGLDVELFRPISGARETLISHVQCHPKTILLGFAAKKSSDESGRKGLDRLFLLLGRLKEQNVPFLLLVFGQGWNQESIPKELRNNVRLMGFINAADRPLYFGGLDYYLCLSRIEGGPYPVMECMACSVKVISTPVGIVPELISHEHNGFIVEGKNYLQTIPDIISQWSKDTVRSRSLKINARTSVLERFSWGKSASPEIYETVYQHALKDAPLHPLFERAALQVRLMGRLWRRIYSKSPIAIHISKTLKPN